MAESDLMKTTVSKHHEKHEKTTVPKAHSNDETPKRTHRDNKQGHHKGENQSKGRKTAMKNKAAQTLTSLVFSILFIIGLASGSSLKAASLKTTDLLLDNNKAADIQLKKIELLDNNKLLAQLKDDDKTADALLLSVQPIDPDLSKANQVNLNKANLKVKVLKERDLKV